MENDGEEDHEEDVLKERSLNAMEKSKPTDQSTIIKRPNRIQFPGPLHYRLVPHYPLPPVPLHYYRPVQYRLVPRPYAYFNRGQLVYPSFI